MNPSQQSEQDLVGGSCWEDLGRAVQRDVPAATWPELGRGQFCPPETWQTPFRNNAARQQRDFSLTLSFIKPYNGSQRGI